MSEKHEVEETTLETPEEETKSEETKAEEAEESTDEYQEELDEISKKELNRKGYEMRKGGKPEAEEKSVIPIDEVERIVEAKVAERTSGIQNEVRMTRQESIIDRYNLSESARKLVKHHLENTVKPSGDVEDDVRNAVALANRKRIFSSLEEVGRSNESRESVSNYSGGSMRTNSKKPDPMPALSDQDKKFAKAYNLSPDKIKKAVKGE